MGVDTSITSGPLGTRRFDSDLASAVKAGKLAAYHAVLFPPSPGTLSGNTLLIVDANGVAGYQASADLVILGNASSLTGLTPPTPSDRSRPNAPVQARPPLV